MQHFPFAYAQLSPQAYLNESTTASSRMQNVSGYGYSPDQLKLNKLLKIYKVNGGVPEVLYDGGLSVNYNTILYSEMESMSGWSIYDGGGGTSPIISFVPGITNQAMRIDFTHSTGSHGINSNTGFNLVLNQSYILSCKLFVPAGSIFNLQIYIGGAGNIDLLATIVGTGNWINFSRLFTATQPTGSYNLFWRTNDTSSVIPYIIIDQSSVVNTSQAVPYRPRTDSTNVKVLNLGSAGAAADGTFVNGNNGSMNSQQTIYNNSVNLFPNSSLEDGLLRAFDAGIAPLIDNNNARSGINCLKAVTNGTGYPGILLTSVKIKPNTVYTFSVYYKNPTAHMVGLNGMGFRAYCITCDNGGNVLGQTGPMNDLTMTVNSSYVRASTTFTSEAGANFVQLYIYQYSNGTAYYDDFQLEEGATATAYQANQTGVSQRALSYSRGLSQLINTGYLSNPDNTSFFVVKRFNTSKSGLLGISGASGLVFGYNPNGTLFADRSTSSNHGNTGPSVLSQNEFKIVAFSWNNTTKKGRFYANGAFLNEITGVEPNSQTTICFGTNESTGEFFDGEMLNATYYKQILTDQQVANISSQLKTYYGI